MFELSGINNSIEFEYKEKLSNIKNILKFSDSLDGFGDLKKEFSISVSKVWSEYQTLNPQNLFSINQSTFKIKFKYTLISEGSYKINDLKLFYETNISQQENQINILNNLCCENNTADENIFNPSNSPLQFNDKFNIISNLTNFINQNFGENVKYFKLIPDSKSVDVIFMEQTLFGVDDCKDVSIIVPDNIFPEEQIMFNQWGLDFEMPFEVHITRSYFESIYGKGASPQKGDIVYIPHNNRWYEVMSSSIVNDVTLNPSYWKVHLIKYTKKSNKYQKQNAEVLIEDMINNGIEDIMGERLVKDYENITNKQQLDRKSGISNFDFIRTLNKNLEIIRENISLGNIIISETNYNQRSVDGISLEYSKKLNIKKESFFAFSTLFKPQTKISKDLAIIKETNGVYEIQLNNKRNYQINDVLSLTKNNFTIDVKLISKTNSKIYGIEVTPKHLEDLNSSNNTLNDLWYCQINSDITLIKAFENNKGLSIQIDSNRVFNININSDSYRIPLDRNLKESWYGLVVNFSLPFQEMTFDLYIIKNDEFIEVETKTLKIKNEDIISDNFISLIGGEFNQTNIRVMKLKIEKDFHKNFLSQKILEDAGDSLIIDNAIENKDLNYIGSAK